MHVNKLKTIEKPTSGKNSKLLSFDKKSQKKKMPKGNFPFPVIKEIFNSQRKKSLLFMWNRMLSQHRMELGKQGVWILLTGKLGQLD